MAEMLRYMIAPVGILIEVVLYRLIMYAFLNRDYPVMTVHDSWLPWVYLIAPVTLGSQNPIGFY